MPARRLSVRKIKEVLRLKASGKSNRKIAVSCGICRSTVAEYLCRAADAGLAWPLPSEQSDAAIEQRLFPLGWRKYLGKVRSCRDRVG